VLRKQREKDEELARARAEWDADNARRSLERKLQLQDKVGSCCRFACCMLCRQN
jgi:hypothetical protein